MKKARFSLFYLAGYLIPAGLLLLLAPTFSTRLLLSNGNYGDGFPRLAGILLIGIGVLLVIAFGLVLTGSSYLMDRGGKPA